MLIYVDDFLILSNDRQKENHVKRTLGKHFKVKDMGEAKFCLGIEIKRNENSVSISQQGYIKEILKRFGMENCKPISTPLALGRKFTKPSKTEDTSLPYREIVGELMYVAQGTRPDIAHAVGVLAQFNSCYDIQHWQAAKRVLRYLQGTLNYELVYQKDNLPLQGFADADWGNCFIDRRSFTGNTFKLCGGAISWQSRKQRTVALSSTEAEYMSLTDAAKEGVFLVKFLKELHFNDLTNLVIFNDNQSAGRLAENPIHHSRTKHIDIRYHFIRRVLSDGLLRIEYLPTSEMVADVLTKGLSQSLHKKCVCELGLKV